MPDLPEKPHAPQGSCVVNHSADKMQVHPKHGPGARCGLTSRAATLNEHIM